MARPNPFASLPKFGRGPFALFLVTAIVTVMLGDQSIGQRLLLIPGNVLQGQDVWTPITANVVFNAGGLGGLLGTLVVQWFIGTELERFWGTRKYLTLVVGAGTAGYVVTVGIAALEPIVAVMPFGGTTPIDMATLTAFGFVFKDRPLRLLALLPLNAKWLAIIFVGISLAGPLVVGPWPEAIPIAVAVAVAAAVTTQPWRGLRDSGKLGGSKKSKKRHLQVVRPDRELLN